MPIERRDLVNPLGQITCGLLPIMRIFLNTGFPIFISQPYGAENETTSPASHLNARERRRDHFKKYWIHLNPLLYRP
jgi:hypothetical protein